MNILNPIQTRWMISSGSSQLELLSQESGDTAIEFDAAFLPSSNDVAYPFGDLVYARVRVIFEDMLYLRVTRNLDRYGLEGVGYDCSRLPSISVATLDEDLLRFRSKWAASSVCPESNFYTLEDSSWAQSVGDDSNGLKHFVVKGTDMMVELLAKEWREIESLEKALSAATNNSVYVPH